MFDLVSSYIRAQFFLLILVFRGPIFQMSSKETNPTPPAANPWHNGTEGVRELSGSNSKMTCAYLKHVYFTVKVETL